MLTSAPLYNHSDQQLDVGVMVGLYGIFIIVESVSLFKAISRAVSKRPDDEASAKAITEPSVHG